MQHFIREPINALTHMAGAVFSIIALIAMIIKTTHNTASTIDITAVIIFGLSMLLLYSASTTYHWVISKSNVIAWLRKLDHSMIYILIAGTYTPFCLITLNGTTGWILFFIITAMAISGVIFKMVWFHSPRWLSTGIYIGMGWLIVFFSFPLSNLMDTTGFVLLIAGGLLYTIGGVIYGAKPAFLQSRWLGFHEIFHIFILLGSLAHFLSVYLYVI
ncbi:PAQR family membrane homeostasis protein TrhA [Saliterribacillus persicus]|uniref:Hemolysin III n=1 Tax=Saliterribacillus persicus TaxID=930114 RepID=A0A368Y949_9BACI|nr:hemolysin III family protein [Saliterribacillus persicus]RCW76801.1 hemolysin III [Saliterribacillus persicus]